MAKILIYPDILRPIDRDGIAVTVLIPRTLLIEANFSTVNPPDKDLLIRILELSEYEIMPDGGL